MSVIVHAENSDPFFRKKNLLRLFQFLMDTKIIIILYRKQGLSLEKS